MISAARLSAFLVLLACMMQLCECGKSQEQKEEEMRNAARSVYKKLFVWSEKVSTKEIVEGVKLLKLYKGEFSIELDLDELEGVQTPKEELCDNRSHLDRLKHLIETAKKYPAIYNWVKGALEKQMELCNYGERFKNKLEQFKAEHSDQWKLVKDFNSFAGRHGIREYDWKGKKMDNTPQMNQAMIEMFQDQVYHGDYQRADIPRVAYNMVTSLRNACDAFDNALGATLLMNTYSPLIKQDQEKLEWLRYRNVCEQARRVDFQQAIRTMWHDTGYLKSDGWNKYQEYWNSY